MSMLKKLVFLVVVSLMASAGFALAQDWPSRPVRVVVPFSPGGAVDVIARAVLDQVSKQLKQPFVIETRVGAGGTIGAAVVAKSDPDGYTFLVHSSSHTVAPALYAKLTYSAADDFVPVAMLAKQPTILFVSSAKGYKSISDFVDAGKKGNLSYGSGGVGNATHLNAERFLQSAGFKAVHVPFKGSPEALTEVLAGRIDFSFSALLPALSLLQDGKIVALATSSASRSATLPNVPTTLEAGFPNSDYEFWIGMMAPQKTPPAITDTLNREITKVLAMPQIQEKLKLLGAEVMPMTKDAFGKLIKDEIAANKKIVAAAGLNPI
ncbi:MAG TPA: tripartite tricarboxylate transporter substrate binding protein [Pseudolabrys sp.]|nr:tripartite tricarboxylate transporter substrate binding protein [Pseudolabrys sp.]